jgi:hypothetical protein
MVALVLVLLSPVLLLPALFGMEAVERWLERGPAPSTDQQLPDARPPGLPTQRSSDEAFIRSG